jgi:O-antigen/teichoic acid export membrane protein
MILGQGSSVFVQTAYFILLARLLGSRQYGVYAGAFALVSIVSQYATLGTGTIFIRYVSPDLRRFSAYWGNILLATVVSGTLIVCGLAIWGRDLVGPASASILLIVAVSDCFFRRLTESAAQVFQAYEQLRYTAVLNTLTNLLRLVIVALMLVILRHATAREWALAAASVSCIAVIAAIIVVTRKMGNPTFQPSLIHRHGLEGAGFSIASSTGAVYNDIDKTMLSHYGMTVANGIYTMAYRVVDICSIPITSVGGAMLPRFFKEGASGGVAQTFALARRVVSRTALFGLAGGVAMIVSAPLIPMVLGKSFAPSVSAVRWLCFLPFCRSLHLSAGDALLAGGYQKVRFSLQLLVAAGNYGANLYLIPRYSWRGAAWASIATDGSLGIMSWAALYWLRQRARRQGTNPPPAMPTAGSLQHADLVGSMTEVAD